MRIDHLLVLCLFFVVFASSCANKPTETKEDTTTKTDTIKNATASSKKNTSATTDEVINAAKTLLKNVKGCYTPSFVPIKFCLNAQGKFTVSSAQKFVFALGSIDLSSSATFTVPDNKLIVQINMPTKSYFYEIKRDNQLKISVNGKAFLAIENHRIVIDAENNKALAIVFENAEKPTTEANDVFLNQFLGISKGMGVGQIVKKLEKGYEVKRATIDDDFAAYEFRKPTSNSDGGTSVKQDSAKTGEKSDTLSKRPPLLLSIVYRRKSGEIIAILANKEQQGAPNTDIFSLAKSQNIVDYKVNLFRSVRGDIKAYLSNYEAINETKESITFIVPCNYSCFPKLTFITREEDLYRCSRVLLYFEKVGGEVKEYLGRC
ncbi:hypothetical protein BKI52_17205 [marine bacterium AO1-C]|nr:hypothetical protein BKI52_17205 [marine bacterium AO1-C]